MFLILHVSSRSVPHVWSSSVYSGRLTCTSLSCALRFLSCSMGQKPHQETERREETEVRVFVLSMRLPCAGYLPKSKVTSPLKVTFCTWLSFLQILVIVPFSHLYSLDFIRSLWLLALTTCSTPKGPLHSTLPMALKLLPLKISLPWIILIWLCHLFPVEAGLVHWATITHDYSFLGHVLEFKSSLVHCPLTPASLHGLRSFLLVSLSASSLLIIR